MQGWCCHVCLFEFPGANRVRNRCGNSRQLTGDKGTGPVNTIEPNLAFVPRMHTRSVPLIEVLVGFLPTNRSWLCRCSWGQIQWLVVFLV